MKKYFLILGFLFVISSCKKADAECVNTCILYFENPQPINDAELSKIPNKFRGLFMNSDSAYINIKKNIILWERFYKLKFHKNQLDSLKGFFELKGNEYVSKLNNDVYDYRYIGDSILLSNKQTDTFFVFSNTQKAKRFNGQLIFSYKDSIYWSVKSIRVAKNVLSLKQYYSQDDLKRMDSITKIKSTMIDSATFISKPSRNEFKRILNLKNFGHEVNYQKVAD